MSVKHTGYRFAVQRGSLKC